MPPDGAGARGAPLLPAARPCERKSTPEHDRGRSSFSLPLAGSAEELGGPVDLGKCLARPEEPQLGGIFGDAKGVCGFSQRQPLIVPQKQGRGIVLWQPRERLLDILAAADRPLDRLLAGMVVAGEKRNPLHDLTSP